jgi:hypothetical protein
LLVGVRSQATAPTGHIASIDAAPVFNGAVVAVAEAGRLAIGRAEALEEEAEVGVLEERGAVAGD